MAHPVVLGLNDCEDGERVFDLTKQRLVQLGGRGLRLPRRQGQGAVLLLTHLATVDKLIDAHKPYSPTVIQTNLTRDQEDELVIDQGPPDTDRMPRRAA